MPTVINGQVVLTTSELATELGVTPASVLWWHRKGRCPGAFRFPGGSRSPMFFPVELAAKFKADGLPRAESMVRRPSEPKP